MPNMSDLLNRTTILVAGLLLTSAVLLLHPPYGDPKDYLSYALNATARVSYTFFILAYVARPLVSLLGVGQVLVANRRYLGLSAAFAHTVHFGYVVAFVQLTEMPDLTTLVGAGLAFVLYWLMAATSNNASVRKLGVRWKHLHRFGVHYLWFIYALTFLGGAGESFWSLFFFADAVLALGLRVLAYFKTRSAASLTIGPNV